jgi:hypothetical protein
LRFVHDASGATGGIRDDDEPETTFDEQRDDVPDENGFVDRDHTSMERSPSGRQGGWHALRRRRALDQAALVELTFPDGDAGGTCPADLEWHGMKTNIAKDAESAMTRTIDPDDFGQENGMVSHRVSLRGHTNAVAWAEPTDRSREKLAPAHPRQGWSMRSSSRSSWRLQKLRFCCSICAGRLQASSPERHRRRMSVCPRTMRRLRHGSFHHQ